MNLLGSSGGYNSQSYGSYSMPNVMTESGVSTGILQYLYYLIIVLVIGLFVLLLINYTVYPVFRTRPGAPGLIPLPGSDDSKLLWESQSSLQSVKESTTPLGQTSQDWSMLLDIQVDNPTSQTNYPRILFTRGATLQQPTEPYQPNNTILTINPTFNICIWLERMTNDLNISVQTLPLQSTAADVPYIETIQIPNVPVGKATRLGVMVGSRVVEVYINGYLVKSKTLMHPLRAVQGDLQPPTNPILSSVARVGNLRLWNRPISPAEFRSYGSATDFITKPLPDSCAR